MIRNRAPLLLSFTLVFAGGLLVGALGHRYYALRSVQADSMPARPNPELWRKQYIAEMNARLKLTPEQNQRLESILDETRERMRAMRERSRPEMEAIRHNQIDKVNAMLTPEQQAEYEKLRQEREQKRKEFEKKHPTPGS